ncbi:hypothetical protein Dimus_019071 [Dionaea muscipula]
MFHVVEVSSPITVSFADMVFSNGVFGFKPQRKSFKSSSPRTPLMAMRALATSTATATSTSTEASRRLTRLFSSFLFTPQPKLQSTWIPPAEPSPNLFVSGLSKRTTTEGLRKAFEKFGDVLHARVVTDRVSGCSKGFGFVSYATTEQAAAGIQGMDGKFLDGWVIFAEYARTRSPPPGTPPNDDNPPPNHAS